MEYKEIDFKELTDSFSATTVDGIVGTTSGQYLWNLLTKSAFYGAISWDEAQTGYDIIERNPELFDIDSWVDGQLDCKPNFEK